LFREQRRMAEERAMLGGEILPAQDIQRTLIPAAVEVPPGLAVDVDFRPMREVGGDFYQVLRHPSGSSLIVIGDVSGKGLKAAMSGMLAIRIRRTLAQASLPLVVLLERLNREICDAQQGGFITCLCAEFSSDGALRLANAGHLPP
jgi:serine phosphatase RsbU (regulator of sigma subunit)